MTKRKQISTEMKYKEILCLKNEECKQQKVADEFGINNPTVSKWLKEMQRLFIKKTFEEDNKKKGLKKSLL